MILTGKTIDAQEAYRIGLVNKVVPLADLMNEARNMAETICRNAPLAVKAAKEVIVRGLDLPLEAGLQLEDNFQTYLSSTDDFTEGIKAFKEKREYKFKGK
jgi:enoyl-CoA hydratase/carnithine racemase